MGGLISLFWETLGYTATPQEPSPELDFKWKTVEPPPELDFKWKTVGVVETEICQDQDLPRTDLVLLTANKHEFEACYKFMEGAKRYSVGELGYVHFGTFVESSNVPVALKICNQGPRSAQTASTQCVQYLNPKAVIFVGICATLKPEKAKLGDVILSYRLDTYDDQKVKEDGSVENRSTQTRPGVLMRNLFLEAGVGWKPPLKFPQNSNFQIHRDKPILSGSKLVNNRKERDELSNRFPDAYGFEMEGAGKQSLTIIINTLHSGKHISKAEGW